MSVLGLVVMPHPRMHLTNDSVGAKKEHGVFVSTRQSGSTFSLIGQVFELLLKTHLNTTHHTNGTVDERGHRLNVRRGKF